jgi:hypothetical protein
MPSCLPRLTTGRIAAATWDRMVAWSLVLRLMQETLDGRLLLREVDQFHRRIRLQNPAAARAAAMLACQPRPSSINPSSSACSPVQTRLWRSPALARSQTPPAATLP